MAGSLKVRSHSENFQIGGEYELIRLSKSRAWHNLIYQSERTVRKKESLQNGRELVSCLFSVTVIKTTTDVVDSRDI